MGLQEVTEEAIDEETLTVTNIENSKFDDNSPAIIINATGVVIFLDGNKALPEIKSLKKDDKIIIKTSYASEIKEIYNSQGKLIYNS